MAGTAVVGAGNYSLEIDTGFIQDAFLLMTRWLGC
jgi:hypothetical protein